MLLQSIFCGELKVLHWSGGCVVIRAIVLQTESYRLPARPACLCHVADRSKLREDLKSRDESAQIHSDSSNHLASQLAQTSLPPMKSKRSLHLLNTQTWEQACARLHVFQRRQGEGKHNCLLPRWEQWMSKVSNGSSHIHYSCQCQPSSKLPGAYKCFRNKL